MKKIIKIEGMSCMHCVKHVKDALEEIKGVASVEVSLDSKTAEVELNENIDNDVLKDAIEDAGYDVVGFM